jgi:hypothetical protein
MNLEGVSKEKPFELEITVVIAGFGKQEHWFKLGQEVKKVLAHRIGECSVAVSRVRRPSGDWYDCPIGVIPAFDYDSG